MFNPMPGGLETHWWLSIGTFSYDTRGPRPTQPAATHERIAPQRDGERCEAEALSLDPSLM
jgi:hypothetical protein